MNTDFEATAGGIVNLSGERESFRHLPVARNYDTFRNGKIRR